MSGSRGGYPYQSARDDRFAVVTRLVERLPDRVLAALQGDREALIELLLIGAEWAWQSRADILGTVQEVAEAAHQFADEVADCYSADRPPSDQMCDTGFVMADRVDALAVEVLHLRGQAGITDDAALTQPARPPAREVRHLARAHAEALREAAHARRAVTDADVEAARQLYQAVVALGREQTSQAAAARLQGFTGDAAALPTGPHVERGD